MRYTAFLSGRAVAASASMVSLGTSKALSIWPSAYSSARRTSTTITPPLSIIAFAVSGEITLTVGVIDESGVSSEVTRGVN